jgi:hypothetical protein
MEVAHGNAGGTLRCPDDLPLHVLPCYRLYRLGTQSIALADQLQVGVHDDLVIPDLDKTTQTTYCERFRSCDLYAVGAPSAAPSPVPPDGR